MASGGAEPPKSGEPPASADKSDGQPSRTHSAGNLGKPPPVDMLLEAIEIENRLRSHMMELVEPTMQKVRQQAINQKELKAGIEQVMGEVNDIKRASEGWESFRGIVDTFRAELADRERQRREHEQEVGERVSLQEIQINELRQTLERKTSDIASVNRALKGLGDSFSHASQELGELRRYCIERLDTSRDKLAKLRDEFESRMHTVECEHFRLRDNQMGLDTTIAHIQTELGLVRNNVAEAKEGVVDLWRAKVSVNCMAEQQQEFSEFARRVDSHVSGLGQQFGNLVDDVKAHFQTAADVVGNTTAQQILEMREKYREEVGRADVVLQALDSFPQRQMELEENVRTTIEKVQSDAKRERDTIRETLQHQLKKAENDHSELAIDLRQLRRTVKDMENAAGSSGPGGGGAIGTDVLSMLVESNLMGSTIELQDDQDRRSIALFGYKPGVGDSDGNTRGQHRATSRGTACALPELDGSRSARAPLPHAGQKTHSLTPRRHLAPADATLTRARVSDPVVTLDKRCLACSGSQATVLAGFKLACLQYTPSPVDYQKVTYQRSELIRLRIDLLNQVKELLRNVE